MTDTTFVPVVVQAPCGTRALKVRKHLTRTLPPTVHPATREALAALPLEVLSQLHNGADMIAAVADDELRAWLAGNPVPTPQVKLGSALFNGTLVFVRMIYHLPNNSRFGVRTADIQTAIQYAQRAAVPIQRYASQYGSNSIAVSPTMLSLSVTLTGNTFNDGDVQRWVDQIVNTHGLKDVCLVLLHDSFTPGSPRNTDASGGVAGYHSDTGNGHPYCFCRTFGAHLTVEDRPNHYAETLSHEIAEMGVDPQGDVSNPEVCDACAGNCSNDQFDLFDANGVFLGGTTNVTNTPVPYSFFINSIVRPELYSPATECMVPGADKVGGCVYPPPIAWNGPGTLSTLPGTVDVAGHFATADSRDIVIAGMGGDRMHEIFWHPAQVGIEGQDDLPVPFSPGSIVSVASLYNINDQRHVAFAGLRQGTVREIFWKSDTVGVEGFDDLPVPFAPGSIVDIAALYNPDDRRHLVVVATTAGKIHEIFWKSDTVGVEGHDDLPVPFPAGGIAAVTAFYNLDDHRHVVVAATTRGTLHEIFWKSDTVGVEGHDDLPVTFAPGTVVDVAGFYDQVRQRHVVAVALTDGTVHQAYWKATTVGIEAHGVIARFPSGTIRGLAGFFSATDAAGHVIVALANGAVQELWTIPDV